VAQIGLMAYKLFTVIACCYSVKTEGEDNSTLVLLSALAATFQVRSKFIISQWKLDIYGMFICIRLWLKHCSFWTHRDDTLTPSTSNLASQDVKWSLSSWYLQFILKK
jgi:hypothetical protein